PWPLSNRDYVYHRRVGFQNNTFVVIAHAGLHKDAPEVNNTIRVEAFASRIAIRSTGVNGCDVFVEYCDESNYSVPNTFVNWGLQTSLPSYLTDLKMACANYAAYLRGLNDDAVQEIPSQIVRLRSQRRNSLSRTLHKSRSYSAEDQVFTPSPIRASHESFKNSVLTPTSRSARFASSFNLNSPTTASNEGNTFFIEFKSIETGLQLEMALKTKQAVVLGCKPNSEAAKSVAALSRGTIIVSVNTVQVQNQSVIEIMHRINRTPRPVLIGFRSTTDEIIESNILERGDDFIKLIVHSNDRFYDLISPRDIKSHLGAVLHTSFQSSGVDIPQGWHVIEINGTSMTELDFNEVVHYLRCSTSAKHVTLSKANEITSKLVQKISLKKKLSQAFSSKSIKTAKEPPVQNQPSVMISEPADIEALALQETLVDYSHVVVGLENVQWVWTHIQYLINEERLFSAAPLIEKLEQFLSPRLGNRQCADINQLVQGKLSELSQVKERSAMGHQALHEFNLDADAGWRFAQTYFGVSTHWKPGDDGTIWLKLDGICEGVDIFNALAVIRETDLFHLWAPFCNRSELLANLGRVELIAYMSLAIPLMQRDAIVHAFGINATYEHRCIVLLGKSITEDQCPVNNLEFPPIKGWNADRMDLRAFRALIEPYGRNRARTCIVVNVHPKCPVPMTLLNFTIKKMAGILLYLLMREAGKIEKHKNEHDPTNEHAKRIRNDPFYLWLHPRMQKWFEHLEAGTLPPVQTIRLRLERTSTGSLYGNRIETQSDLKSGRLSTSQSLKGSGVEREIFDCLYDVSIWPYLLLGVFYGWYITPTTPLWMARVCKCFLTCVYAWFGVAGSFSWQARCNEHVMAELSRWRLRVVLFALCFEVLSIFCTHLWSQYLVCHIGPSHLQIACTQRSLSEIRATEHFWMLANSFLIASFTVGIQIVVKIHI
ncbi:transmembrane protein, partial [Thraustotheca clavata]